MAVVHESNKYRVRSAIHLFRLAGNLSIFTAANVAALTTVAGLRDLARNITTLPVQHVITRRMIVEAVRDMENLGILTNTNVAALSGGTALTGLIDLLCASVGGSETADSLDSPLKNMGGDNFQGNSIVPGETSTIV